MFFYIVLFSLVLHSVTCEFPPYITRCPLPDPNANDCLLNSARNAMPFIISGDDNINLPNITRTLVDGDSIILEYNFQTNNTVMQLFGEIFNSPDTYIYEARINLAFPNWNFVLGGSLLTTNFDFLLNIYDDTRTIQAKGTLVATQDNWRLNYNGDYIKQQIGNELFMQIQWAYSYVSDDTFDVTYIELTTLDDQPFTGPDLIRVKKAIRNFENSYRNKQGDIGEKLLTDALNIVLKQVPENQVFIPIQDQCPQN